MTAGAPPAEAPGPRREPRRLPAAAPGVRLAVLGRLGQPAFWLVLVLFILVPAASSLILVISPRLFGQGAQWLTLTYLRQAFTGATGVAIANSLWVSTAAAVLGVAIGLPVAWLAGRTTLPGRRLVPGTMWLVLLLPSWLPALGWERLVQPDGVMYRAGLDWPWVTHAIMGPFGVVLLLGLRSVPFTFLAVTAGLAGLGQEFEDAARTHGAGRAQTLRLIVPMLAPAIWSALAIGFTESISDFGVAATLAYNSNFSLATYQLYQAIDNFPPSFPAASAMGALLVAAVAIPLSLQARALRGRSYQMLSGRSRQVIRRRLSAPAAAGAAAAVGLFYLIALGVPGFGAVSGSLLGDFGGSFTLTLANYRAVLHQPGLLGPLERSTVYGLIAASITVIGGFTAAWLLAQRRARSSRLDFLLLSAIALPSVVFAAGYIFAYNLPFWSDVGISLYQTAVLLIIAYIASSLPTSARVLSGAVSQLPPSLRDAARTHGAGAAAAWARGVLPVISRPLVMAWLLTFCGVFLELPISQLLYQPGSPPASVGIEDNLGNYHFEAYPGAAAGRPALSDVSLEVEPGTFLVLLGPSGSGKTTLVRCLAGIERISTGRISIGGATVADGRTHVPPEKRELAMVFQDYALWPHLTAAQNVAFALRRRRLPRPDGRARADAMLARVGLAALGGRYPNELSGGEQQRVALARALVADTGLILCDEPLSNLDADLRERMRVEIAALVRDSGATAVYITHDQAEAFALADRVGVLEQGRLVQLGPPEEIYARPASPFVARFTGLAGELRVRTAPSPVPGHLDIEPAGPAWAGTVRLPAAPYPDLARGGDALLMIRPTGVALCDPAGEPHLTGTVADAAFRGRGYEHAVDVPGHGRLTGVFAARRADRGSRVGLRLDAAGCHLFPAAAAAEQPAAGVSGPPARGPARAP